eukprot:gene4426-6260_t
MPNFLIESFEKWVKIQPNKTLYSFLDDYGDVTHSYTYQDLYNRSQLLKSHLQNKYPPNTRILLVFPPSIDFIIGFIGCLLAGMIAVPTFPPNPTKPNAKEINIFQSISNSSESKAILTSQNYYNGVQLSNATGFITGNHLIWPKLDWIVLDTIFLTSLNTLFNNEFKNEDIAFLQYTSGSTSEPKGVMITHGNLSHNLDLIITGLSAKEDTVVVSWLPQYHDMGLIGSYLGVIHCGGSGFYMSPFSFIKNPCIWVVAMSRYHATHIQAPNFAYALTARKFLIKLKQLSSTSQASSKSSHYSNLDLSSVRHMINAAEPIDQTSIESFYSVFTPYGLKRGVIFPTYGLAEHTVYVCSNGNQIIQINKEKFEKNRIIEIMNISNGDTTPYVTMIGCGNPSQSKELDLKIVDISNQTALPENRIGEIWINSPSKAKGYFGLNEKTMEDFHAKLSNDITITTNDFTFESNNNDYLRTGDLGFIYNNELFICGRSKDLIIINGRNYYPQDIEKTCENVSLPININNDTLSLALRPGCTCSFSIRLPFSSSQTSEVLVFVGELNDNYKLLSSNASSSIVESSLNQLINNIRGEISQNNNITASVIYLLASHSIQKTTSGKIARQLIKNSYLEGSLLNVMKTWSCLDENTDNNNENDSVVISSYMNLSNNSSLKFDPTGQPLEDIIIKLQQILGPLLNVDPSTISANETIYSMGLESGKFYILQESLVTQFTTYIPEELLSEPEATLTTIATCLQSGGDCKHRPIIIPTWEIIPALQHRLKQLSFTQLISSSISSPNKKSIEKYKLLIQKEKMTPLWYREHMTKAHVDTLLFPNKITYNNNNNMKPFSFINSLNTTVYGVSLKFIY